ncbi:MAG: hypothetical protein A2W97_16525 [Bacteroidetes bacterium GWE2_40_63]|nr:MAG: hypothetical protein A2W84_03390 [Bacteroidetes bacterium GWC2_40_13]OFX75754.1 MAG: hypothetical protein A2W96_09315 [Bacteroidetes bacterium GWD2_40_43]OFX94973.1 MAG: hypothetical protein A2W97_16525 [Bacteroidetes bacterium GWE2_40_63]OFY23485.1 MAG: hypothetical protein A2W88_08340 [Bacteroidetes bacterium GWF2_40_13]HBX83384.1 hypothetical protein [Marinilabiliales bacterium]
MQIFQLFFLLLAKLPALRSIGYLIVWVALCMASCNFPDKGALPLTNTKNITNQVIDSLLQLSDKQYRNTEGVKQPLDNYLKQAIEIAKINNHQRQLANIYNQVAKRYRNISEYSLAISFHRQSLSIANQSHDDELNAKTLHEMAVTFRRIDDNAQALKLYMQALEWAESANDTLLIHSALNGIGNVYISYNNYTDAIEYFKRSLNYLGTHPRNLLGEAINTNNIGEAYLYLHNTDSALYYLQHSYNINVLIGSNLGQAICNNSLGMVYMELKQYTQALEHYQKSLDINQQIGDLIYVADNHRNLGNVYMQLAQYPLAEDHLKKALEIGKNIGSKWQILEANKILSELYSYTFKTQLALEHMRESLAYKDSMTKEVSRQNAEAMDVLFKAEKQEREIIILKQDAELKALQLSRQRYLFLGIATVLLALAMFVLFAYRQRKLKNMLSEMSLEQKLLRAQLNPHFVFNSLSAVQNFILNNDKKAASEYLVNFSRLMRNILMGSGSDFILLENELQILDDYLKLQQLRFQNKFDYYFELSNGLDPQTCQVPPMLVQPFIENAIEHGVRGIERQGVIFVRFTKQNEFLVIEVEDNGKGLQEQTAEKQPKNHVSMATKITKQRMQNLQNLTKKPCYFEIIDKPIQNNSPGVLIKIQIPYQEE